MIRLSGLMMHQMTEQHVFILLKDWIWIMLHLFGGMIWYGMRAAVVGKEIPQSFMTRHFVVKKIVGVVCGVKQDGIHILKNLKG